MKQAKSSTQIDGGPASPLEIFIVDDDPDIARFVSEVATPLGFSPRIAGGAKALMALMEKHSPAAIIMDIVMPDMDGVELIQWLGSHHLAVPIVIMTGYDSNYADAAEAIGRGNGAIVLGKLTKPFDISELEAYLFQIQEANQ
jgi:DNA-binding response OmpR family regulator